MSLQKMLWLFGCLAVWSNDEIFCLVAKPTQLVSEIYRATAQLKEQLTADQLL
jgi:hypothetical protein